MSSFAFTNNNSAPGTIGDKRAALGVVTLSNSYPTGGEAVTPATFGLTIIDAIFISDRGGANTVSFDSVASKLKAFVRTTGVEVANTTDLSAVKFNVMVVGS